MEDRISDLPDEILCHILSFLPTKEAVATSILSKRWKPLWLSVTTLDFDYANFRIHDFPDITVWLDAALQRRVEHIDISLPFCSGPSLNLSSMLSCKTLVVLKLKGIDLKQFPTVVDFPFLKVLHLQYLYLPLPGCLAELLYGCPVLEDLKVRDIRFTEYEETDIEFKTLPQLVRADISGSYSYPFLMKVVNNVQFLRINQIYSRLPHGDEVIGMFHNLTHIELVAEYYISDWFDVVRFLKYCPKLQVLVIKQPWFHIHDLDELVVRDLQCSPSVPECILLHLKRCYLDDYRGTKGEFQFAKYIMQNGRFLKRMTICSNTMVKEEEKLKNIQKLSLCTRCSVTCELSFK